VVRRIGAQIALLAFSLAILAGLYAGNQPGTILTRAWIALLLGLLLGQAAAWTGKAVLRDFLRQRKVELDRKHFDALRAANAQAEEPAVASPNGG
jgi:hypothetical protein